MRARLSIPAALAALAVAGTAFTGFSAPASAAPSASAQTSATARTVSAQGSTSSVAETASAHASFPTATAYRARGVKIKVAHKRITRAQVAKRGMKVTVTGLKKRTKVYIAAGLPNSNEPILWSKTVRASRSGKATLRLTYTARRYDRLGRHLPKGRYMVGVLPYSGTAPLFRNAFRVR